MTSRLRNSRLNANPFSRRAPQTPTGKPRDFESSTLCTCICVKRWWSVCVCALERLQWILSSCTFLIVSHFERFQYISKNFLVNISESYSLSDMFILKFFSKNNFNSKKLKYLIYTSLKKRLTIFFKKYLAQINVFYVADDIETWRLLSSFLECVLRRLPWDCFVYLFLVRRIRGDKWYVAKVHLIAFELFLLKIHGSKEPFHVRKTNRVIAVRSVWILAEGCLNV